MDALLGLTAANLRSFTRDRAAVFWTIAFPVIFIFLFGTLFGGNDSASFRIGWVDQDGSPASAQLGQAFGKVGLLKLTTTDEGGGLASARSGQLDAVIVVPRGYGAAVAAAQGSTSAVPPVALTLYTDPSHTATSPTIAQIVEGVTTALNQALSGRPPALAVQAASIQGTATLNGASYFFPIALMPDWLQGVAKLLPLTYLGDALRQTMVGGSPFVPLALCFAVLTGWLVVCLAISARFFRWQ